MRLCYNGFFAVKLYVSMKGKKIREKNKFGRRMRTEIN